MKKIAFNSKYIIFVIISLIMFLCGAGLYWYDTFSVSLSAKALISLALCAAVFVTIAVLVLFKIQAKKIMITLLIIFGIFYFFACPSGMAPDEDRHFLRAFQISEGHLLAEKVTDDNIAGDVLPENILDYKDSNEELDWSNMTEITFPESSIYSPVSYLPQAIGIRIARLFTNNISFIFRAGRFASFIVCMFFCIMALKKMPFAAEILFMVIMFPTTMQEMISLSADGLTISLALLFTAYILDLTYRKERITRKDMILLALIGIWLSVIKVFYFVMAPLLFIIPFNKFRSRRDSVLFKILCSALMVISTVAWMIIASAFLVGGDGGDASAQIQSLFSNCSHFIVAVFRTLSENIDFYVQSMIGAQMGALCINASAVLWVAYLILFIYEAAGCRTMTSAPYRSNKWIFAAIFLAGTVLIFISLFIQWTSSADAAFVSGVQGRYFTPIILLLALIWVFNKREVSGTPQNAVFNGSYYYMIIAFSNSMALMAILRYYL